MVTQPPASLASPALASPPSENLTPCGNDSSRSIGGVSVSFGELPSPVPPPPQNSDVRVRPRPYLAPGQLPIVFPFGATVQMSGLLPLLCWPFGSYWNSWPQGSLMASASSTAGRPPSADGWVISARDCGRVPVRV